MSKKSMIGLQETLEDAGYMGKRINEAQLDFTLPPPIYGYHLTTNPEGGGRQIKVVKAIHPHPHGIRVVALEGQEYIVSWSSIKFYREE